MKGGAVAALKGKPKWGRIAPILACVALAIQTVPARSQEGSGCEGATRRVDKHWSYVDTPPHASSTLDDAVYEVVHHARPHSRILAVDPDNADRIFAYQIPGGWGFDPPRSFSLLRSLDRGCTWKKLVSLAEMDDGMPEMRGDATAPDATVILPGAKDSNRVYLVMRSTKTSAGGSGANFLLFRSNDNGESFEQLAATGLPTMGLLSIAVGHSDPDSLYAITDDYLHSGRTPLPEGQSTDLWKPKYSIYRSKDGGKTWEKGAEIDCPGDSSTGRCNDVKYGLQVDREDANAVFFASPLKLGGPPFIYASYDSGSNWTQLVQPMGGAPSMDSFAVYKPDGGQPFFLIGCQYCSGSGSPGVVAGSFDGGETWQPYTFQEEVWGLAWVPTKRGGRVGIGIFRAHEEETNTNRIIIRRLDPRARRWVELRVPGPIQEDLNQSYSWTSSFGPLGTSVNDALIPMTAINGHNPTAQMITYSLR